jgi:beta-glucanase (GH16 family)
MLTLSLFPRRLAIAVMAAALTLGPAAAEAATSPATGAAATGSFVQIFGDDFDATSVNRSNWAVYDNAKSAKAHLASNVVVHDGMATLATKYDLALGRWTTAGMCLCANKSLRQTYGEWEMRARVSAGDSRAVALLWPSVGWPPEVDFMEMGGEGAQGARQLNTMTMHYGPRAENYQIHSSEAGDFTQWHTVGVQWAPGVIRYLLDGQVTKTVTSPSVPNQPMWFGVQTSPEAAAAPTKPVNFDIDWVKEYAYDAGGAAATRTAPSVTTAPSPSFVASQVVGSDAAHSAMPVAVSWAAKPGSSAICKQLLTRGEGQATPFNVPPTSATATKALDTVTVDQTIRYTAQATGCDGLASAATAGAARIYKLAQQGGYSGSWSTLTSSAFSGGSIAETYAKGAWISFYMGQAAAIALVGERGPHKGAARVYLDGKYLTTLNNYASATAERRVLWTDTFAAPGPHILTIVNVGTAGSGLGVDALAKLTS